MPLISKGSKMKNVFPLSISLIILISVIALALMNYILISTSSLFVLCSVLLIISYCIFVYTRKPKPIDYYQQYLDDLAKNYK